MTGDQPIFSEYGDVIVVLNGEIYNYESCATELRARGHVLRTSGDTESIVAPVRGTRAGVRRAPARDVRASDLGPAVGVGWCWRATVWARSRCSTASAHGILSFASELGGAAPQDPKVSEVRSTSPRSTRTWPSAMSPRP